jgi:protein-tyrosine phosphatase
VTAERHLDWEGCLNVRDLGGMPAADGRVTPWGAVVRSDDPGRLTPAGWAALRKHGIRTIVDLRNDDERDPAPDPPPQGGIEVVRVPLDDVADTGFWRRIWDEGLDGTPLYYRLFLEQKAGRCAAAVAAVADALPGGVLVHCGIGRDRAGLVALLLLDLVGVAPADIAEDWELSDPRLAPLRERAGAHRVGPGPGESLAGWGSSAREVIVETLAAVDVEARLLGAGLTGGQLRAVRDRLLEPSG